MVVVSHDRYLVERVCDTIVALFGDGRITHLPGGIEEYLNRRAAAAPVSGAAPSAAKVEAKKSAADLRAAQKELGRLERKLDQLHAKEEKLHASLLEAATDPAKLMELNAELKGVQGEIEDVEARWLETSELLE
jgi:ATP-binding cassette subfamily F protein uup